MTCPYQCPYCVFLHYIDFSIIGAIIIALGLYSVVWGKGKGKGKGKDYSDPTPPSPTTKKTETQHLPITSSDI